MIQDLNVLFNNVDHLPYPFDLEHTYIDWID